MAKKAAAKKEVQADSPELVAARAALAPFFKANRSTEIREGATSKAILLFRPWNDRSVALFGGLAAQPDKDLIEALNNLILPERLTALYHKDTKTLEVVWTAYKIPSEDEDISKRKFVFNFDGKDLTCEFGKSSDRLLAIAGAAIFLSVSETGFRNLQSFSSLLASKEKKEEDSQHGEPLSFFIRDIKWSEDDVLDMIRHLNFYLRYYDLRSPFILIHPAKDQTEVKDKNRYVEGQFPDHIISRNLNQTLLSFWAAAYDQDVPTRFLLHFRILEFVSSYHLQNEQRMALKKLLSTPSIMNNLDMTIDSLAGIVREEQGGSTVRFNRMFDEIVDSDRIWGEICLNPDSFTKDLSLDGGFHLKAIIQNVKSKESFGAKGMENVARALRHIRNGLAHGGEAQAGRIILPTSRNFKKLLPWVHLIATAAGEVVLYEHLT